MNQSHHENQEEDRHDEEEEETYRTAHVLSPPVVQASLHVQLCTRRSNVYYRIVE